MISDRVGIIGLGTMGEAICRRLLSQGKDVLVFDKRPEPMETMGTLGARIARSSREIAEMSDTVLIVVLDDSQVNEVVLGNEGLDKGIKSGALVIIHSTVHPATCRHMAQILALRGVNLLDAAMTGGRSGIESGTLTLMVGGKTNSLNQCRELMDMYSGKVFHVGEIGTGMVVKLCVNAALHSNRLALYESIQLAVGSGVDPDHFIEVLKVSAGRSWVSEHWNELDYQVLGSGLGDHQIITQLEKDLSMALQLASSYSVPARVAKLASELLPSLIREGLFVE